MVVVRGPRSAYCMHFGKATLTCLLFHLKQCECGAEMLFWLSLCLQQISEGHCEDRSQPDCPRRFISKKRRKHDFLCTIYFYFCFVIIWCTKQNTKYLLLFSVGENCKMQTNFSIFPEECLRQAPGLPDIHLLPYGANDIFLREYYPLNGYSCSF